MARLTRHQLKQDDFSVRLGAIQEFFLQNQQKLVKFGGIAAVIAVVVIGGLLLSRSRGTRASGEFAEALALYHAPVSPTPQPNVVGPQFKTEAEKDQQALAKFNEVAGRYSWTSTGKYASYYAALCQRDLGNLPEAEKELAGVVSNGNRDLASLAKMALGGIYEQTGRNDQAQKMYSEVKDQPTVTVPKATAELALAQLYQKTNPAQAKTLFQQIEKDYPGMAAGDLASKTLQGETP